MKMIVLGVVALSLLLGCNKSEDAHQDANGACKQEYLDSWNAVADTKNYPTLYGSNKSSACADLKAKSGVSCKANVMVFGGTSETKSGERNISYSDFREYCEPTVASTPATPSNPYQDYSTPTPAPTKKYSNLSGGRCNQEFLDLYNSLTKATNSLNSSTLYSEDSKEAVTASKKVIELCAEKKIAESQTSSCLATKTDAYSYYYRSSITVYLSEFNSSCSQAERILAADTELTMARSVRVFSKAEKFEGALDIDKGEEIKAFNSVSGATYLFEGKWFKQEAMKNRLARLADDKTVCNITHTMKLPRLVRLTVSGLKESKETVVIPATPSATEQKVELQKVEFTLTSMLNKDNSFKVRCLKKTEITFDDIENALNKTLLLEAKKVKTN